MESVQEGSGEDYLEKIIQMPIQIPDIQSAKLDKVLLHQLNEILTEYSVVSVEKAHWQHLYSYCIAPLTNNLRDINRLCNAVQFKLAGISSEVDFADLVAISALEIHFPKIYEWVKNNKPILTGELYTSIFSDQKKTSEELYVEYSSRMEMMLKNTHTQQTIREQVEIVIGFLSVLFRTSGEK